jgi:alpha-galactosidase
MSQKNPKRKITFIGAGSTVFAKNLLGDILSFPELADSSIYLYDIDRERLATSERVARRIGNALGIKAAIESTTDMGQTLDGAAYAISMIQVGGIIPAR